MASPSTCAPPSPPSRLTPPRRLQILLCAKGIEQGSLKLMTEVLAETIPRAAPAVLSGPSFAAEVARGLPTAVTLACPDEDCARDSAPS